MTERDSELYYLNILNYNLMDILMIVKSSNLRD